jgi:hypothetical protein
MRRCGSLTDISEFFTLDLEIEIEIPIHHDKLPNRKAQLEAEIRLPEQRIHQLRIEIGLIDEYAIANDLLPGPKITEPPFPADC